MFKSKIMVIVFSAIALATTTGYKTAAQSDYTATSAQTTAQSNQTMPDRSPTQSETTLSDSDQEFVMEAAQGGIAEVQLGQLASQQASSNAVKQFGQRMVKDHTQANNQLKQIASQKGITLPNEISEENQKVMERLSKLSGAEFDLQYMQHMVEDHTKDVSMYQREAKQGDDPELKTFASETVPILQQHLQLARSISANLAQSNP